MEKEVPAAGAGGALCSLPGSSAQGWHTLTCLDGSPAQEQGLLVVQGPHRQKAVFEIFDCERAKYRETFHCIDCYVKRTSFVKWVS